MLLQELLDLRLRLAQQLPWSLKSPCFAFSSLATFHCISCLLGDVFDKGLGSSPDALTPLLTLQSRSAHLSAYPVAFRSNMWLSAKLLRANAMFCCLDAMQDNQLDS